MVYLVLIMTPLLTKTLALAAMVAGLGFAWSAYAQTADTPLPKIWHGVYTTEQAERGRTQYVARCAHCHGEDLSGGDGPALIGSNFSRNWGSRTVERLFKKVKDRMPPGEEFVATDAEKLDIITTLLAANGFPAGKAELTLDQATLAGLLIVGKNGPEPPPSGAMIEAVGCLAEDGANWKLINATEPAVSTMDDVAGDAKAAVNRPLGKETIRLMDVFPKPEGRTGHKMMVKGLLIRQPNDTHVNVMVLEPIATECK